MAETLDETDLQILKTLQRNAKLTTKELADAVHLTPTPVFERQKRLEKKGFSKDDIDEFVETWSDGTYRSVKSLPPDALVDFVTYTRAQEAEAK